MATAGTDGRRAIPRAAALATVQAVLPEINLETSHARPLFDEIVDRSQLLLPSDRSRTEFSFRHGTLQEYLAARALIDKPAELLRQYKRDPDAWREVVRLWCNSSDHDCTTIVQEVTRDSVPRDRILGLQCVADARRISGSYSAEVVDSFVAMLGQSEPDHAAVVAALGSVIASGGPRGRELMSILISKIRDASTRAEQQAAMLALSASGHPEAAEALAPLAATNEDARTALRSMGELIVPVLARRAEASDLGALDDLALIATPAAAEVLVAALYRDDRSATRAAWLLAQLLRNPGIEDSIRYARITVDTDRPYYDWIWRPFARPEDSSALERIAGRIAYLLDKGDESAMPETIWQVDERIALPVAGIALAQSSRDRRDELAEPVPSELKGVIRKVELDNGSRNPGESVDILPGGWGSWKYVARVIAGSAYSPKVDRDAAYLARQLMDVMQIDRPHRLLVGRMPWPVAARLLGATSSDRFAKLQPRDWLEVEHQFQPAKTLGSILRRSLAVALASVLVIGTILRVPDVVRHSFTQAMGSWLNVIGLGLCVMVVAFTIVMLLFDYDGILGGALLYIGMGTFATIVLFDAEAVVRLVAIAVGTIGIIVVIGFGVAAFAVAGWRSARRSRQVANPFRHILHAQDRSIASRRSILAY